MASSIGDLPAEIQTISGLDLISSFLFQTSPPQQTLVSGIDALLASQTHSTLSSLRRGDLIQIQGAASSGKTQLLLFFAMTALLPPTWSANIGRAELLEVSIGGNGKAVVWCDATQRFDIVRLTALLRKHLESQLEGAIPPGMDVHAMDKAIQEKVEACLENLHVFSPTSTLQLAATIRVLPDFFKSLRSSPEICYVIIDGLGEFSWMDQLERDRAKEAPGGGKDWISPTQYLVEALAHVRKLLSPIFLVSEWVLRDNIISHRSSLDNLPFFQPHLEPPWPIITTSSFGQGHLDSLEPPLLPLSKTPTIPLKFHITIHSPPVKIFKVGTSLKSFEDSRTIGEGFRGVMRQSGGKEVGGWDFDVLENAVFS